jgi:hypothetical protein
MKVFDFGRTAKPTPARTRIYHNHYTMECVVEVVPEESRVPRWELRLNQVERENLIAELQRMNPYPR